MLKNKTQFLSTSKVATMFGLINPKNQKPSTHTLRFWETKFKQLKPTILSGGRRYYTEKNIDVIKIIIFLLKDQGLTINGAVKAINKMSKKLDDSNSFSIKELYYKKNIKLKSKIILEKIKKLNGKKIPYKS
jgi:DNA-binding transcriptional MerR regulator|tara:strand:+ start:105 stop:500 length:396 start_codon:yes stop_codon:yes gene_type:complete